MQEVMALIKIIADTQVQLRQYANSIVQNQFEVHNLSIITHSLLPHHDRLSSLPSSSFSSLLSCSISPSTFCHVDFRHRHRLNWREKIGG